jgi:hypothetical protein
MVVADLNLNEQAGQIITEFRSGDPDLARKNNFGGMPEDLRKAVCQQLTVQQIIEFDALTMRTINPDGGQLFAVMGTEDHPNRRIRNLLALAKDYQHYSSDEITALLESANEQIKHGQKVDFSGAVVQRESTATRPDSAFMQKLRQALQSPEGKQILASALQELGLSPPTQGNPTNAKPVVEQREQGRGNE